MGRRVTYVGAVGAVSALAAYLTVVGLNVLPGKPLLLVYAFLLSQVYGQLMVGAAPLLKQYFLPVSLTSALILSVPSSGGTVPPDLLPAFFRDLSYVLPLAQGVTVTRGVAYFHNSGIAQATLVLGLWAAVAAAIVALTSLRQSRVRVASRERVAGANAETRVPGPPVPSAT
jgi:ABC-type multidrug transport system permease subunit